MARSSILNVRPVLAEFQILVLACILIHPVRTEVENRINLPRKFQPCNVTNIRIFGCDIYVNIDVFNCRPQSCHLENKYLNFSCRKYSYVPNILIFEWAKYLSVYNMWTIVSNISMCQISERTKLLNIWIHAKYRNVFHLCLFILLLLLCLINWQYLLQHLAQHYQLKMHFIWWQTVWHFWLVTFHIRVTSWPLHIDNLC